MTNVDTSIPSFLKRKETAKAAKKFADEKKDQRLEAAQKAVAAVRADNEKPTAVEQINEARKKDGLRPYDSKKAKVPKKAGKLVAKALAERDKLKQTAKEVAAKSASKPKDVEKSTKSSAPKGWPREGSKNAILLNAAISAGKDGSTWAALAKKVGWTRCNWSLKTLCKQVGAKLDERNDRVYVTLTK